VGTFQLGVRIGHSYLWLKRSKLVLSHYQIFPDYCWVPLFHCLSGFDFGPQKLRGVSFLLKRSGTSIACHLWGSFFMTQQTVAREESELHANTKFSEDILLLIIFHNCTISLLLSSSSYNTIFSPLYRIQQIKHQYFANCDEFSFYIQVQLLYCPQQP